MLIQSLFPLHISKRSKVTIRRSTRVFSSVGGREERNSSWRDSRRIFDVSYGIANKRDYKDVVDFFERVEGSVNSFLFKDWSDHKSSENMRNGIANNDQVLGTGNGVDTSFGLVKHYNDGAFTYTRPIRSIDESSLLIAVDGVATTTGFTYENGYVVFDNPVPINHAVSAGYLFYNEVYFVSSKLPSVFETPDHFNIETIEIAEVKDARV